MRKVIYLKNWTNFYKKYPDRLLSVRAAKKRHENRKPYAVVIENDDDVRVVCYWFTGFLCQVLFVDEFYREHLQYSFEEVGDGKQVFLCSVSFFYYQEPGAYSNREGKSWKYQQNGNVKEWTSKIYREGKVQELSSLEFHYEPIPEFGHYESIARYARDRPPEQDTYQPGNLQIAAPDEPIDWANTPPKANPE